MSETVTQIAEYSEIDAAIAELRSRFNKVPDVSTKAGLKDCKKQYKEVRSYEISLEKKRKELGTAARAHLALVNDEAKRIDGDLKEISGPYKTAFETREAEIKAEEEKRVNEIQARIAEIHNFAAEAKEMDSDGVQSIIEAVDLIDCSEFFDEFTQDALKAVEQTKTKLGDILQTKLVSEAQEEERLKLERQRKANEIEGRINKLKMIPLDLLGQHSKVIQKRIDSLRKFVPPADEFGDRHQEAVETKATVISQLEQMKQQAQLTEPAPETVVQTEDSERTHNNEMDPIGGDCPPPVTLEAKIDRWALRHCIEENAVQDLKQHLFEYGIEPTKLLVKASEVAAHG